MAVISYVIVVLDVLVCITAKHYHPIPTYFQRLDEHGNLIDRASPDFNAEIESKPRINRISREDAASIRLETWPVAVKNGEKLTIIWTGVKNPQPKDYIAHYCPYYDDDNHYLDYVTVKDVPGWENGTGHYDLTVYNMRETCIFKFYREKNESYVLAAISNKVYFADGGPYAPLQGHIAMTNVPTEMRVMWTSGELTQPPVVRYGRTKNLEMKENEVLVHSYTKDSLCQSPANGDGFWKPGYMYDVLLYNLAPNTMYYYSYGTDEYMSYIANFTTPLPKGDRTPYKFVIYGDMGVDPSPEAYATAKNVRKDIDVNKVRFVFHHGDISYARGYAYIWEQWFWLTEPYATLVPYMVGVGNHEYDHTAGGIGHDPSDVSTDDGWRPSWFNGGVDSGGECGVPMFKRYHMPENGNSLFWYSFDYGMVHMIMMSTEHDYSHGSPQYQWLENDLHNVNRSVTPWVFIGGHRAMYCSEKEYSDYVVATHMQELFEDLLYKYKVDIGFWAHYHSYERTCKLYKNKCTDDGVIHIVVGSAGKSKDIDEWYPKKWSLFHISAYGYGRVTVANSSSLLYEWIANEDGKVKDYVWLHK